MAVLLLGGSDRFDFGKRERGVIAWGVAASPDQGSRVYVGYKTEKFTLPVLPLTVLVRVTVLVR